MASNKAVFFVAFLLAAALAASVLPQASALCFDECYDRCANGKVGDEACGIMCAQACIVPKKPEGVPDGQ